MAGRRSDPAAFRPDPSAARSLAPTRRQAIAMVAGLALVAGTVAVASVTVKPNKAHAFDLFYGSVFLSDERAPVAVDLTNGRPTVRLVDANTQVSAKQPSDLSVVPLTNSTLLLDRASGEFNMVDSSGFVIKTKNGGVPLPKRGGGATTAAGIAAGTSAYIVQSGPAGASVYLVGQSTVQSATGAGAKVKPRAYAILADPAATTPGGAASANGDLWLRVGSGAQRTIRQFSLPRGSNAGVPLHGADRARVPAASAIGTTTGRAGGDVVAVGAPNRVQVFSGSAGPRTFAVSGLSGVDTILAATDQSDTLSFLYHSNAGWSLVSVPAAGTGGTGPITLPGIGAATQLTAPATSRGALYTMDLGGTGRVWQIGRRGEVAVPAKASSYPVVRDAAGRPTEVADFSDAYAIARGSRVVFNSPSHVRAVALFTDASHAPVDIDKSSAVSLNAAGGATSLTRGRARKPDGRQPPSRGTAKAAPTQPISDRIRCRTVVQVPHIPTITKATPGSRSVQLQWSYPLLDPRDCIPSTYTVSLELLSSDAPAPPAAVTVQGQDGVNLAGLFPDTRYKITVTAYLNGRGTPSAPVEIATGPEGPAAPTNVHASTDGSGDWTVTWNSCGGVTNGCVQTATWNLIPSFCDGAGLSSTPATVSVAGDPTQHTFRATFPGNDSLLGRGLDFQVEGIGTRGTVGSPGSSNCAYSWRPPVTEALTLTASQPATTTLGGSTTTTVNLAFGRDPVRAAGGIGAQVSFRLSGPSGTQTIGPVTFRGASHLSATFKGVQAGAQYHVAASVSPPKHSEATATVGPVDVVTRAEWPDLGATASCPPDPGVIVLSCSLTVQISGISSRAASGERFDLADGSGVRCGNTVLGLTKDDFDPASDAVHADVQLLLFNGNCTVTIALVEHGGASPGAPLVFGGTTSPSVSRPINLGSASTLDAGQGDFAAGWDNPNGTSNVRVSYQGAKSDDDVARITTAWSEHIHAPNGSGCGSDNNQPSHHGAEIAVDPTCVNKFGGQTTGWTVTVGYQDKAGGADHSFTYQLSGGPPTYQPCAVVPTDFAATWAPGPAVTVTFNGVAAQLAGCTSWRYVLSDTTGARCGMGQPIGTPSSQPVAISDTCADSVRTNAWTVTVFYDDTAGDPQTAGPVPVGGTPP